MRGIGGWFFELYLIHSLLGTFLAAFHKHGGDGQYFVATVIWQAFAIAESSILYHHILKNIDMVLSRFP